MFNPETDPRLQEIFAAQDEHLDRLYRELQALKRKGNLSADEHERIESLKDLFAYTER